MLTTDGLAFSIAFLTKSLDVFTILLDEPSKEASIMLLLAYLGIIISLQYI